MKSHNAPFIKAILYGDIFDFPLTEKELWKFAIADGQMQKKELASFIAKPPLSIKKHSGYFYLADRDQIVGKRMAREKISQKKCIIAKNVTQFLSKIPTIRFIGISGGVAMQNADKKDDIDFFIIASRGTVWTTRVFVLFLLELYGMRRRRKDMNVSDRICVNMFLDEAVLALSSDRRDIYTAHEVAQVMPLYSYKDTYERFLKANSWIDSFLPNARAMSVLLPFKKKNTGAHGGVTAFEMLVKLVQLYYMKRHRTRETVSDTILAFHPIDYRGDTIKAYNERVRKYEKI